MPAKEVYENIKTLFAVMKTVYFRRSTQIPGDTTNVICNIDEPGNEHGFLWAATVC